MNSLIKKAVDLIVADEEELSKAKKDDQQVIQDFFTPDGRPLSRAPYPGAPVTWNQSYHPNDSSNLWAGRYVHPVTGRHEYIYVDNDLSSNPTLNIHRQNVIMDMRIDVLRRYTSALMDSPNLKDKVTGLMLILLDQARFRLRELTGLKVSSVVNQGDACLIGVRKVVPDYSIKDVLATLTSGKNPEDPLFTVPVVDQNGGIDYSKIRRLGPNYIVSILKEIGVPLQALATYHASQTYSCEIQRILSSHLTSYEIANHYALLEVCYEMGHNFNNIEDYQNALNIVASNVVDPIVIAAIKRNVDSLIQEGSMKVGNTVPARPMHPAIYVISSDLSQKTPDEKAFSEWLHGIALHEYL